MKKEIKDLFEKAKKGTLEKEELEQYEIEEEIKDLANQGI